MTDDIGSRIYLDTTVFIEAFEGVETKARHLRDFFLLLRTRPQQVVTSEFVLAEVLGKESDKGWSVQTRFFLDLIVWSHFDLVPVSREILLDTGTWRRAARRSGRKLALPDAIHVVTAAKAQCRYLLSSDKRMVVPAPVLLVDPHGLRCCDLERMLRA